jgi:TetR/AcrR family transcriptional regulator, transcriptional repressor for nem operon
MGRASKETAERHRDEIEAAASRRFRADGLAGVSVPALMAEAGLTHGGFYRHFASKEELAAKACARAFAEKELSPRYLSAEHVADRGNGCPMAALAGDISRTAPDSPLRDAFAEGVARYAEQAPLADLATMVGALVLARATEGRPISDAILAAARDALGDAA